MTLVLVRLLEPPWQREARADDLQPALRSPLFYFAHGLRSFNSRGITAGCREMNMQVVDVRRREQLFQDWFDLLAIDQSIIHHHCVRIERPHCKDAAAQLFRNLIHLVVGLIAFTHKDGKPHPIRRIDRMMFVIDQQKLLAWLRVREANPARIFAIDCPAHSALGRKIDVRQVEKVGKILSWQPGDSKGHGCCSFSGENHFAPATDRNHPIPEHLASRDLMPTQTGSTSLVSIG